MTRELRKAGERRPRLRATRRLLAQGSIAAVLLLGVGATAAWAAWTAQAEVPGDEIQTGELDLQFDGTAAAAGTGTPYAKTLNLPITDLTPKESAAFAITPENAGTTAFSYGINLSATLPDVLTARVYSGAPLSPVAPDVTYPRQGNCSGTPLGPQVELGTGGKPGLTTQSTLPRGASDALCIVVSVRADAPASAALAAPSVILDFVAAQVMP